MNNNQNAVNEKRVDGLMAAITLYTTQLEDYDKSNFSACMTCIGFVGGLIAAVGAILCTYVDNGKNILLNEAVSVILLLIPAIVTLFLYNFSMSCRRSALFRGYVQFLEECVNKEVGNKDMLYSKFLIPEYYAKFPVNKFGPIAMIIFLFILYFFGFWISFIFAHKSANTIFITAYNWGSVILFGFCTFFDILYIISLMRNDIIIKSVKDACMNENNMEENI